MTKVLLIFILSISSLGLACDINFSNYTYKLSEIKLAEMAQIKGCKKEEIEKVERFINDYHGSLSAGYLKGIFSKINFGPSHFSVFNIKEEITNKKLSIKHKVGKVKLLHHQNFIVSDKAIELNCENCSRAGEQQFSYDGVLKYWGKVEVLAESPVLEANKNYGAFTNDIEGEDFTLKKKWVLNPEDYYYKKSELKYYKVSSPISVGELLKKDNLMSKNIVHSGQRVEVILSSKNVKIVTDAISRSTGHYLQDVLVENTKTKKKYTAKIIGVNKVKVEL